MVEPFPDGQPKRGNDANPPAYAYIPHQENPHYQPLPHSEGPPAYQNFGNPAHPQGYPPLGYPPQGFPPQGFPPQSFPPHGYPPQPYPVYSGQSQDHHDHNKKRPSPTFGSIFLIIIGALWFLLSFFGGSAASFIIPSFYIIAGILGITDSGNTGLVISIVIQFILTIINGLVVIGTVIATLSTRDFNTSEGLIMFLIFGGLTAGHIISLVQFFKAVI